MKRIIIYFLAFAFQVIPFTGFGIIFGDILGKDFISIVFCGFVGSIIGFYRGFKEYEHCRESFVKKNN